MVDCRLRAGKSAQIIAVSRSLRLRLQSGVARIICRRRGAAPAMRLSERVRLGHSPRSRLHHCMGPRRMHSKHSVVCVCSEVMNKTVSLPKNIPTGITTHCCNVRAMLYQMTTVHQVLMTHIPEDGEHLRRCDRHLRSTVSTGLPL